MADYPRIKWLNIDGQQVPFTEPQHFTGSGDETVQTGKDNPLPVANYTQNDTGIWMPVSKDNPMPTQVTGSIVYLHAEEDITISAGSNYTSPMVDLTDVKKVFAVARSINRVNQKFSFRFLWSHSSTQGFWLGILDEYESSTSNQYGDSTVNITGGYLDIKAPYSRLRISNTTEDDDDYLLIVLGVV